MAMKNDNRMAIGLDIGGTRMKTVLLSSDGKLIEERRVDSHANEGPDRVRSTIREGIQFYIDKGHIFQSIGIGCAGSVNPETGVVVNSPNFANWSNVPLKNWVQEDFKVPVAVGNDANLAAFTEWKLGNAKGVRNAVLLTFGTGVGGGIILDGKLFTGSTGTASEIGHFSICYNGIACACGNTGCFERYCSASAVEKSLPGFTAKEIFARSEESPFKEVVETFFHNLCIGVVSVANLFDPDVILLGGGLSNGIFPRLKSIEAWVSEKAFPLVGQNLKIVPTAFSNLSGAMGAALLSLESPDKL